MDSITLLKADHKAVQGLFKRFENAGEHAYVEKRAIVDRIIEELSVHAAIEEQLFYPVVRATVPEAEALTLESLEEHHIVKWLLSELEHLAPQDERFTAKVTVLIENVRHHVKEEENDLFPQVRKALGRSALSDLGEAMADAKATAPTHPHPRAADTPPTNLVVGGASGVADRLGDTMSGIAQGGVTVVGDIIATVLRRKKPRVSPTGSTQERKTAERVRSTSTNAAASAMGVVTKVATAGTARAEGIKRTATVTKRVVAKTNKRRASVAKKASAKKAPAKKAPAKKAPAAKKTSAAKRTPAKRATASATRRK